MRRLYNGFQSDPCIRYDVYSPSRISATTLVSVYVVRSRVTRRVYGAYNVAFEQCEELAAHYNRRVLYRMSRAVHDVPDESGLRSTPRFAPTHTQPPALIRECVRACVITVPDMPLLLSVRATPALAAPCARNMLRQRRSRVNTLLEIPSSSNRS